LKVFSFKSSIVDDNCDTYKTANIEVIQLFFSERLINFSFLNFIILMKYISLTALPRISSPISTFETVSIAMAQYLPSRNSVTTADRRLGFRLFGSHECRQSFGIECGCVERGERPRALKIGTLPVFGPHLKRPSMATQAVPIARLRRAMGLGQQQDNDAKPY
jgi:hypothetical protein